jgi:hypothetical protein
MKKVAIVFSFLAIIISFISCGKDTNSPEPIDSGLKLKKIIQSNKNYSIYKYENDKIVTCDVINYDTVDASTHIYYDENNRIIKSESISFRQFSTLGYSTYDYNSSGKIIKAYYYNKKISGSFELSSTEKFEYDVSGRVIKSISEYPVNTQSGYSTISYDSRGNIIEIKTYRDGLLLALNTYEYDSGFNPLRIVSPDAIIAPNAVSKNNIVKETYVIYSSGVKDEGTKHYSYEYNPKNYPVKCYTGGDEVFGNTGRIYDNTTIEYEYY